MLFSFEITFKLRIVFLYRIKHQSHCRRKLVSDRDTQKLPRNLRFEKVVELKIVVLEIFCGIPRIGI